MKTVAGCCLLAFTLLLIGASGGVVFPQEETIYDSEVGLVSFEDLAYPTVAKIARNQGVVVVMAKLDDKGNVVSTSAITGPKTLIPDCLSNAKKWKFQPNPHKSAVIVYEFRLADGACHDASHSLFQLLHRNFASITACSSVIGGSSN
jgi:Gram-negative bacterial TonB protein C-terminal